MIQKNRMERVCSLMEQHRLDAILVSNCALGNLDTWLLNKNAMPLHLPYNRNNLCFVTKSGTVLELCAREPHPTDWGKFPLITETDLSEHLKNGRLGLVNPTYLKKVVADDLKKKYAAEFVDVSDAFHLLKAHKIPEEIDGIGHAAAEFDRVFTTIPLLLTGEHTEREIAVALRNRLREMDAECEDLQTSSMLTITSAPDGADSVPEPILYPGRRVTYGDRINIQVNGFMPSGFATALGRCYVIGSPSAETQHYWSLATAAQQLIAQHAKPGVTIQALIELLRDRILAPDGLPLDSSAQIYGIGAGIYEAPRNVDATCNVPLEDGMTLVIAPKICPDGKDPYCCADVFTITPEGAKRLSKTSQELYILD